MSHVFDISRTRRQQVLVEYLTDTGSGFAITPQGEQVFMNKRLVDAMNVQVGDIYDAFLLPNYPDKRAQIPWRAMRVEPTDVGPQDLDLKHVVDNAIPEAIVDYMRDWDDTGVHLLDEIAEGIDLSEKVVEKVLKNNPDMFVPVVAYVLNEPFK